MTALKQQGVTDEPEVQFYEFTSYNTYFEASLEYRAFLIQKVQDYDEWVMHFGPLETAMQEAGISTMIVARNVDDVYEVAIAAGANDKDLLKSYFKKAETKSALKDAAGGKEPHMMFAERTFPYTKVPTPGTLAPTGYDSVEDRSVKPGEKKEL